MSQFYSSKGIVYQTSCVESPHQKSRVETKHQHILNLVRALLFLSNLPNMFWSYALLDVSFIINRVPSPILQKKSLQEMLYSDLLDLHVLKVFGSSIYASTLQANRTKLSPRGRITSMVSKAQLSIYLFFIS